ncbi:hypothetical protein POEJIIAE_02694 [Mannheimia haemolytica]
MPVITRKIKPDSWVYTDTYRSYDALDVSEFHHERINHSELFAEKQNHINGIENFGIKRSEYSENITELTEKISLYS